MAVSKIPFFNVIPDIDNVNIDTYTGHRAYIALPTAEGTLPTGLVGNRFMILSDIGKNASGGMLYGMQLAISFGSNKIAVRNSNYSSSGSGVWSEWRYI